jgi:oxalate decarboxylase
VESSQLAAYLKGLAASHQTRRGALRRLGLSSLAAGLLTTAGAQSGRSQTWELATPTPGSAPPATAGVTAPIAGVSGGLPPFVFDLEASAPTEYAAGTIRWATSRQFSTLEGVSIASQRVAAGGLRELHWHLNTHELSYCLAGQGRIGIFAPDGKGDTFEIQPGTITFVPEGYTHYIQNTGDGELHMAIAFSHEQPETANLSASLPGIPTPILGQNFGVPASDFPFLTIQGDRYIVPMMENGDSAAGTPVAAASSPYSVNADQLPVSQLAGGTVQPLTAEQIPTLRGITVFPLSAVPHGLREPHWHTNAAELNYCISGQAQIGLVAPDGNVQTFAVGPGTIGFMPENWLHYIVSVSDEPLMFLIYFVTPDPKVETIGLAQTFGYFPPEILAASFGIDAASFAALPKPSGAGIMPPVAED